MNRRGGFSYAEVIIALAVFLIAAAPVFPSLSQARKNAAFARERYESQSLADSLVQSVKRLINEGALTDSAAPGSFSQTVIPSPFTFGFWVRGAENAEYLSPGAPEYTVNVTAGAESLTTGASVIITAVWDGEGKLAGRAVGVTR